MSPVGEDQVAREDHRLDGPSWYDRRWLGVCIVSVLAAVSGVVFTAGIQTPWPWGDEGATYLALQRDWAGLLVLLRSPDAPNVPYYFVAKAWVTAVQPVLPSISTLVAVRLLSATAASATVVALYALVARRAGRLAGLFAGLILLSLPGFSRYAQEARTYTLLALAATLSCLLLDRLLQPPGVPSFAHGAIEVSTERTRPGAAGFARGAGYAASLAFVAVLHTFGLFQWPAHVLMALTAPGSLRRRVRRLAWMAVVLAAAAGLAAPQVLAAVQYGTGPTGIHRFRVVDPFTVVDQVLRGISLVPDPRVAMAVLSLSVLGILGLFVRERRAFVLQLVIWLVVPISGAIALAAMHTNLFRYRYWIAFLPPLAALAGLGLATIAALPGQLVRRLQGRVPRGRSVSVGVVVARTTGAFVALVVLAVQVTLILPAQLSVRGPLGHGENLGEALALLQRTASSHPGLTAVFSSPVLSGPFAAVDPALEAHNPLLWIDPTATTVYTSPTPSGVAVRRLASDRELLWILPGHVTARQALRRWPADLASIRPRVLWVKPAGPAFTAVLLAHSS